MKLLRIASAVFLGIIGMSLLGSGIAPAAYNLIQDEGTSLARRSTLNFSGAGVLCADATTKTTCAISGVANSNYTQSFTSQATVVLAHNLNTTNVLTQCFNGSSALILPNTTVITDANNVTVTFTVAQTGFCNVNGATSSSTGTIVSAANACLSIGSNCYFGARFVQATVPGPVSFSWQNQGSASVSTNANGTMTLTTPAQAADSIHIRYVAVPAAPYTVTGCFAGVFTQSNSAGTGLSLSDGTGIITLAVGYDSTVNATGTIQSLKFTNATTFNSVYSNIPWGNSTQNIACLRFRDDGVNRLSFYSADGQNFFPFLSQTDTDFITPTRIGWFYNETTNAGGTTTLISWTSTSP